MASTTISLRTDTELKAQAEEILNQLGMTLNGTFNMLLNQIVREKSVPLSLSLRNFEGVSWDTIKRLLRKEKPIVWLFFS